MKRGLFVVVLSRLIIGLLTIASGLFAQTTSTPLPQPLGYFRFPAIAGEQIIFTAEGDLWRVPIQGGMAQRLTTHPAQESRPAVSPDGKTLAYSASYEGPTEVYTMPLDGGVPVRTNERVERVQRNKFGFHVDTAKAQHHARYVVLALGRRGTPRRLQVPGEDMAKVSYRLIEAETYADKDVLVVGGGDSAIEAALALSRSGKNRVALSYRGDNFQRARERNRQHLDQAAIEGKIEVLRKSNVLEIRPDSVALDLGARRQEMPNDYTFVMVGGESPEEFLRKTGIEIVEKAISL